MGNTNVLQRFAKEIKQAAWFAVNVFSPRVELEDAEQEASLLMLVYADQVKGIRVGALGRAERDADGDEGRVKAIIGAKLRLDLAQMFGRQVAKDETCASLDELPPDISSDANPEDRWVSRIGTHGYVRQEYPCLYFHAVKEMELSEVAELLGESPRTLDRRIAEEKLRAADDPYFIRKLDT